MDRHTSVDNFKGFKSHQGKLDVAVRNPYITDEKKKSKITYSVTSINSIRFHTRTAFLITNNKAHLSEF